MATQIAQIPLIDFAPFLTNDIAAKQQVAQAVFTACHDIGFLYLKNPGISQAVIERGFAESQRFFNRPLAEKVAVAWGNEVSNRGYIAMQKESLNPTRPGDYKEAFNVGQESAALATGNHPEIHSNHWPLGDDRFRDQMLDLFAACNVTANQIFRAFSLALQLPESFIGDRHITQDHTLRLLHYPPITHSLSPNQIRAGEHSDYGSVTLLFQDSLGGLEVKTAEGEWIAAPSIPNTVLVNIGDLMQRWSNDLFRSTLHRVVVPTDYRQDESRYSIAFFCQPDFKTEITCIESCQSPDRPARYAPILAGKYLLDRLKATY
jgi:isopenicillin N synthase-like dioxygenase